MKKPKIEIKEIFCETEEIKNIILSILISCCYDIKKEKDCFEECDFYGTNGKY